MKFSSKPLLIKFNKIKTIEIVWLNNFKIQIREGQILTTIMILHEKA